MLFPTIQNYIGDAIRSFDSIPEERKKNLAKIACFIQQKTDEGKISRLIYVCTHNSRRSHLGQVWGKTAAWYYGIKNADTYSAGTEATAFHPHAILALRQAGFRIEQKAEGNNPVYFVTYSEAEEPVVCFSKTYEDNTIPNEGLCAIMTCTEADGNCPFIHGTELRIPCPYDDPKTFDGTPQQEEKYNERCKQIAAEQLYVFSLIANHP
jgi:arsenate reductase